MKTILLLIVICLYSCTPGKLIGEKKKPFVYTPEAGTILNAGTYGGSLTAPANVGSYTVVATINDKNYFGSTEKDIIFLNICVFGGFAIICLFLFFYRQRDETITMPDNDIPYNPPFQNF